MVLSSISCSEQESSVLLLPGVPGLEHTPLPVAVALQSGSAALPGVKPKAAPPRVSFSSSQSRGHRCHEASLMISSPWAGGVTTASGGGCPPSFSLHPHFFPALSALGVLWPLLDNPRPWDRAREGKWQEGALISSHSKEREQ